MTGPANSWSEQLDPGRPFEDASQKMERTVMEANRPNAFTASDATKELLRSSSGELSKAAMDEFFALWETENDPRKAASVVAHRYMVQAATIAVFGAVCAGREPQLELWLAVCEERFNEAIIDVAGAVVEE